MNSRMRLAVRADDDKPHNSSKGKGVILETPYKPGFVDDKDLETVKMAVDKELSDISNAFYQTTERTADTITRVDKLEITGESQYGELSAKIETVDKVSKEGDVALAERITTFEASTNNEFGKVNAAITETNRVMASEDKLLAERIDSIVGSFEGELGPLFAQIDEVRQLSITGDAAIGTRIDNMEVSFEQADKDLAASIKTESESRVDADTALSKRIDTLSATVTTEDKKLSAAITTEQTARVDADKALATSISKVEADYKAADVKTNAAITTEANARSDGDKALASTISKVEADYKAADGKVASDTKALIQTEATARVDGDSALAGQIVTVKSELDGDIASTRAAIQTESTARTEADKALASQITTVSAEWKDADKELEKTFTGEIDKERVARELAIAVAEGKITQEQADRIAQDENLLRDLIKEKQERENGDNVVKASVQTETNARVAADNALSSQITTAKSELNGTISSVQQTLQTNINAVDGKVNNVSAKWGISVDAGGNIAGIQLNSSSVAGSEFRVLADRMVFTNGSTSIKPISIEGAYAVFNNIIVRENCIVQGTIYADKMQGNVSSTIALASLDDQSYNIAAAPRVRTLIISGVNVNCSGGKTEAGGSTTARMQMNSWVNGVVESTWHEERGAGSSWKSLGRTTQIPANTAVSVRVQMVKSDGQNAFSRYDMAGSFVMVI